MQNPNPFENGDKVVTTAEISFFNDPLYESESVPTQTFQPTHRMIPQPNNIFLMCENISNSIKTIKKIARKQLEQADELKSQLAQLKQFLNTQQQQPPMPRRINRNRVRSHPNLNEHPSISSHTSTYCDNYKVNGLTEQDVLSNSFHPQHADASVAATGFSDGNEIFSTSSQNFEFFNSGNNTYNAI
jgi:hypothetical protein